MTEDVEKATSNEKTVTRPITREVGQPHIVTSSRFIQDLKKKDLRMPRRLCTYSNMMLDDSVSNSVDVTNIQVLSALSKGEFVPKKGSNLSNSAADFLNYCIRNMSFGTWREAMNTAATDLVNGFAIENIVVERAKYGKYKGAFILKKLAPRTPDSVYGWVWDKHNRELKGFVQKPMVEQMREPKLKDFQSSVPFTNINGGVLQGSKYPFITTQQMLLFRHDPTFNNPEGNSPLNACYDAWTEKKLVEHFEVVGVSKDFGGLVIVRVPNDMLERANNPDKYPEEAKEYIQLQTDASNLQAGKTTQIVLSSDTDDVSRKYLYDMELKGIDGAGKQYSSDAIIQQKRKSIYNVFGTGFLLLGQDGHGSNALAGSQMTNHDRYIQRAVEWKEDVINNQLAPRLLAVNDVYLDWKDMPEFVAHDPSNPSWDVIGKLLQRAGSVGMLNRDAVEDIYIAAGWDTDNLDEIMTKLEQEAPRSRAGESQGSSGVGSTQSGGATTATNSENKSFVIDYETEDQIVAVDTEDGSPIFIDKEE